MNWRSLHQWQSHIVIRIRLQLRLCSPMQSAHRHYLRDHFRFWAFLKFFGGATMKSVNKFCFLSGLLVALLGFLPALAQVDYATATLKGTVTDPQGAVIVEQP